MIHFIKKMFMLFLTLFFPWIILLMNDNPGGAFIALALQFTLIGWPFAVVWAWRTRYPSKKKTESNTEEE